MEHITDPLCLRPFFGLWKMWKYIIVSFGVPDRDYTHSKSFCKRNSYIQNLDSRCLTSCFILSWQPLVYFYLWINTQYVSMDVPFITYSKKNLPEIKELSFISSAPASSCPLCIRITSTKQSSDTYICVQFWVSINWSFFSLF